MQEASGSSPGHFGSMPVIPPPGQWRQEGQRFKLFLLDIFKVQKQPGIQETLFPKKEDKRAKFPATEFMPISRKQKLLTGFQGTKKGRIWKTLYQIYGPIIKVVQVLIAY